MIQKEYYDFYLGISKEELSINSKTNNNEILIPEKEYYEKDEIITFKRIQDIMTEEDSSIINKENTCYSHFFKGFSNFWNNGNFPNITNPNICYNTNKFLEHKNILDCGFAKISFNYGQKKYNVQTCYFIPNDKLSKYMLDFYRRSLIEEMWGKDGIWGRALKNQNGNNNEIINEEKGDRKLQERDDINFEMTIQNKNGKVIKYDSKSYNITVVQNSNNTYESEQDNNEEEEDSDIEKIIINNSEPLKFNWLISIYIILILI